MANEFMDSNVSNSLRDRIILMEKELKIVKAHAASIYLKLVTNTNSSAMARANMSADYNNCIQSIDRQQKELDTAKYLIE